jgi:hypothetical protein
MQNKPNFPHFSPENDDFAKKQTQFKPNSNPIKANFGPILRVSKAKQTQFYPGVYPLACPRCMLSCFSAGGVVLPRLAAGKCELTLLWSLPSGVLTCFSAGGRGSNPIYFNVFCFQRGSLCSYALMSLAFFPRSESHYSLAYFVRPVVEYPCYMFLAKNERNSYIRRIKNADR